ncbi:MAG: chromate resistance protein ChrB domain-containing protein [Labedaea sp.]
MKWATRANIHIDRAACAWLIRRHIDPDAEFTFVTDPAHVPTDATPFDMRGVELSHHNGDCSFETILRRYHLDDPVLWPIAAIIHEADLDEADAFVAASLSEFSLTTRLAFLVVGPMIDHLRIGRGHVGAGRGGAAVNRQAQAIVLFLLGTAVLHASLTDLLLRYVKAGLRPLLLVAGVVLILAAIATMWYEWRGQRGHACRLTAIRAAA